MKRFFFAFILVLLSVTTAYALPSYQEVCRSYVKSDSLLLDRHGEILYELRTDKNRRRLDWTRLAEVSPALIEAVIQAEDRRFLDHSGVDYRAITAALLKGLSSESLRGASTITMQLASFLSMGTQAKKARKSLREKGHQILDAWEVEKNWSKAEILETYLNLVTFRGELQGIASASRGLFGKDPHGLDQAEALVLASLIRSPNAPSAEISRRASSLNQVTGWNIPADEIHSRVGQIFLGAPVLRPRAFLAPHVARQLLKEKPKGAAVTSTLDRRVQEFALSRLAHHLLLLKSQNARDGAILVIENTTGNVLAYGSYSREPSRYGFVDGIQAKRQAGSTLKPLLYGYAFDRKILTPASILDDTPLDVAVVNGIYQPKDYDSEFKGQVTARVALASSLNVPAVKTLSLVGVDAFLNILRQIGIGGLNESGDFYGPSLALGSADVSLWELTNAYRTLAQQGEWTEPRLTAETKSRLPGRRIFSKEAAFLISDILSDREARSPTFGLENPLATRFWAAVKTGTSKEMRDNWCIGYSRRYTVGVWIGNFSGEPMWNVSGVTGAAPVWSETMTFLERNEPGPKRMPPSYVGRREIEFSQSLGSPGKEWFIRGTEPNSKDLQIGQVNQRILYPPSGTVIALDPDIPPDLQRVFFISQSGEEGLQWRIDETIMERTGKTVPWSPKPGKHLLCLLDGEREILDSVNFEVRGPSEE